MACLSRDFLEGRIATIQSRIEAWEDAEAALAATGGVLSYTIDTGQSRQVVTRVQLGEIRLRLSSLYNQLVTLEARLGGCGVVNVRPGW